MMQLRREISFLHKKHTKNQDDMTIDYANHILLQQLRRYDATK